MAFLSDIFFSLIMLWVYWDCGTFTRDYRESMNYRRYTTHEISEAVVRRARKFAIIKIIIVFASMMPLLLGVIHATVISNRINMFNFIIAYPFVEFFLFNIAYCRKYKFDDDRTSIEYEYVSNIMNTSFSAYGAKSVILLFVTVVISLVAYT